MGDPPGFEGTSDGEVALWDEMPLWSAMAGLLLLEHVPLDARRVLDLGSGTGFPTLELAERLGAAARVIGVDPWGAAVRRAEEKRRAWPVANATFVRGDAAALPFRDGSFDLAVSNLGIHNFADPAAAYRECRRVLAPGGRLALSTNVTGHFAALYEEFDRVLAGDEPARERLRLHIAHRGTRQSLARDLERAGFHIVHTYGLVLPMRFRDGAAVLGHHFIRLGFLPAWVEVAGGERGAAHIEALAAALDRRAAREGGIRLDVPLLLLIARR